MSVSRFTVESQLDSAGGKKPGTVTIDRETNIVTIRPHRSRAVYHAKLEDIADLIVKRTLSAGYAEALSPKNVRRRG